METKPFAELGLSPKVLAAIETAGYTTATPIQSAAIPVAVTGRDVLGIAQTGTGKTAAFVLPMITRLETGRARARMPRSLILAPTRELAAQVAENFEKYGINNKLDMALLIGGVSMDDQVKKLDRGVDVLIATPGRLLDHFGRGRVMLMGVEILVIDEADRMLDMGFIPDIEKICKLLPPRRQTLFFSATMPPEITRLVDQFLKEPVRVEVAPPATMAKTITQRFVFCPESEDWAKRDSLRKLLRMDGVRNAIIFCNRKVEVAILLKSLTKHGFNAGALHGDMDQKSRMETLDKFRKGEIAFLAASDVAARGLDIPDVSHVFNYDLPRDKDDYVHRIGRTGRAGKEGHSTSLVTIDDLRGLQDIEKITGLPAEWLGEPPTEQDYADSGKKRRGRGRGAPAGRSSGRAERDSRREGGGRGREQHTRQDGGTGQPREQREPRRHDGDRQRPQRAPRHHLSEGLEETAAETPRQAREERPARVDEPGAPQPAMAERPREQRPRREREHRGERGEHRGEREPRGEREQRGQDRQRDAQAQRPRGEQSSSRSDAPREPRSDAPREPRSEAPRSEERRAHRQEQQRQPERQSERPQGQQRGGGNVGFADNIPAFMRRPSRPAKAANE